jgi:predicted PurR-regulated permease PerM
MWNASQMMIGLTGLIAILYYGRAFCVTMVISVIITFILDPFVHFFMKLKLPRGVASFVVCTIALLLFYLLGLGVYTEVASFADDLPSYSLRANTLVDSVADRVDQMEQNAYKLLIPKRLQERERGQQPDVQQQQPQAKLPRRTKAKQPPEVPAPGPASVQEVHIRQDRTSILTYLYAYISSYYNVLLMLSFVPFLVYFMLSWRDHVRRSFLTLFDGGDRVVAGRSWHAIADMARAYVFGNFLLGILLATASSVCFWSWHLPYWAVVGPVSGFLSLVPYVGLPLAMVPPLLAALATYDRATPFLIISAEVGFLHLLALNLLYPKIVGARVHLNPLAVTVALMFWGTVWGGIGLILAIPVTAALKAVFDHVDNMQPYGRLLGD